MNSNIIINQKIGLEIANISFIVNTLSEKLGHQKIGVMNNNAGEKKPKIFLLMLDRFFGNLMTASK
jgi:hypothetical protein